MTGRTRAGHPDGRRVVASDGAMPRPVEHPDWTSWSYLEWLSHPIEPFSVRVQIQRRVHLKMRAARNKAKKQEKNPQGTYFTRCRHCLNEFKSYVKRRRDCRDDIKNAAWEDLRDRTKGRLERLSELYADGFLFRADPHPPPLGPACRVLTAPELDRIAAVVRKSSVVDDESTVTAASRYWWYRKVLKVAAIVLTAAVLGGVWRLPVWAAGAFACVQAGLLLAWWWSVDEWLSSAKRNWHGDSWLIGAGVATVVAFALAGRPPPWLAVLLAVPLLGLTLLAELALIVVAGLFVIPWVPYGWFRPIDPYARLVCCLADVASMMRYMSVADDPELWHYAHVVPKWVRHMNELVKDLPIDSQWDEAAVARWEEEFKQRGALDPAAAARAFEFTRVALRPALKDLWIRPTTAKLAYARGRVKVMLEGLQPTQRQGGSWALVEEGKESWDWSYRGPAWTADQVSDDYLIETRAVPIRDGTVWDRPGYPRFYRADFTPCGLLESACGPLQRGFVRQMPGPVRAVTTRRAGRVVAWVRNQEAALLTPSPSAFADIGGNLAHALVAACLGDWDDIEADPVAAPPRLATLASRWTPRVVVAVGLGAAAFVVADPALRITLALCAVSALFGVEKGFDTAKEAIRSRPAP